MSWPWEFQAVYHPDKPSTPARPIGILQDDPPFSNGVASSMTGRHAIPVFRLIQRACSPNPKS